jgi:hypothetical protein
MQNNPDIPATKWDVARVLWFALVLYVLALIFALYCYHQGLAELEKVREMVGNLR